MTVFLTGGGGGLGAAIANGFARRGIDVAVADRELAAAQQVAKDVSETHGVRASAVECDVTDPASVAAAWTHATEQLGPIDVLVNNAGVFAPTPFLELTPQAWDRTLQVNLYGAFHTSQRAARDWLAAGTKGAIVNIASIAAMTAGYGGTADYGASKAGLVGLTIHLAVDLGPHGIRTNAVAPGSFYSPMNAERLARPGEEEHSSAMTPLKRIAQPEEVAAAVLFLALDATYVNGVVIPVDGGTVVRM